MQGEVERLREEVVRLRAESRPMQPTTSLSKEAATSSVRGIMPMQTPIDTVISHAHAPHLSPFRNLLKHYANPTRSWGTFMITVAPSPTLRTPMISIQSPPGALSWRCSRGCRRTICLRVQGPQAPILSHLGIMLMTRGIPLHMITRGIPLQLFGIARLWHMPT